MPVGKSDAPLMIGAKTVQKIVRPVTNPFDGKILVDINKII